MDNQENLNLEASPIPQTPPSAPPSDTSPIVDLQAPPPTPDSIKSPIGAYLGRYRQTASIEKMLLHLYAGKGLKTDLEWMNLISARLSRRMI